MKVEVISTWNLVKDQDNRSKDLLIREGDIVEVIAGETDIHIRGTVSKLTCDEMYILTSKDELYSVHKERLKDIRRIRGARRFSLY